MVRRISKYALHKASKTARVCIDGKTHSLGAYNSPESHERYDKLIAKWLSRTVGADRDAITVNRLAIMYVDHSRIYYVKDGIQTSEVYAIQAALRPLTKLFGTEKVSALGPKKLKQVREQFIENGAARSTCQNLGLDHQICFSQTACCGWKVRVIESTSIDSSNCFPTAN